MALALPTSPQPFNASPRPLVPGRWQKPGAIGGAETYLDRLGARWALDIVMPRLKPEPDGRTWAAILTRAAMEGEEVLFPWPQPGLVIGSPGTPLVAGAGQAGTTLNADGFSASYAIRAGQFFSIVSGGRRYIHSVRTAVTASGGGVAALSIVPPLRVSPTDNAVLEFAIPLIQGKLTGEQPGWTFIPARVEQLRFSIEETR
jgi:hypothetical protein